MKEPTKFRVDYEESPLDLLIRTLEFCVEEHIRYFYPSKLEVSELRRLLKLLGAPLTVLQTL